MVRPKSPRARRDDRHVPRVDPGGCARKLRTSCARSLALGQATVADATNPDEPDDALGRGKVEDLAEVLASNMSWYIEWPHIDGRFVAVYAGLAGVSTLHVTSP